MVSAAGPTSPSWLAAGLEGGGDEKAAGLCVLLAACCGRQPLSSSWVGFRASPVCTSIATLHHEAVSRTSRPTRGREGVHSTLAGRS